MKLVKQLFDFYINASIHVALAVFSLTWITLIEYGVSYDDSVLYFVFFASITGYNFVKYFGVAKFHHRRLANWLKTIQMFSLFCFVFMCFYANQLNAITLIYIAVFGVITFLYAIPFLPKRLFLDKQHNLRGIGGLKIYLIALVWCGVTVFLPLLNNQHSINADVVLTGFQRYIFVMVLMLPFEIRDLQFDDLKLSTIPQKIGTIQTKIIGVLLLMLFFFLEFFKDEINARRITLLLVIMIIILLFLVFSTKEQGKYYSSFWVESIPILWLFFFLIT